jgi:hypothetical protein
MALFLCAFAMSSASAHAEVSTAIVTASADAYVSADNPDTNYGSATSLEVAGSPAKRPYLRFDVSVPDGAVVTRTELRLFFNAASSSGYEVHTAPNNAWSEGSITFANAPRFGGANAVAESISAGWNSLLINPIDPGTVTHVVTRAGGGPVAINSRENTNKPRLLVEYTMPIPVTTVPATPPFVSVEADARVEEAHQGTNYGTSHLRTDGGGDLDVESYMRFSVGGFLGRITSAKLRVRATTATVDGPALYTTSNGWSEDAITWSNRPARTSTAIEDKGAIAANTWVEYDVTPFVRSNGTFNFALATSSSDDVNFASREGTFKPKLVVTTTSGRLESRPWVTTMSWEATVADFNIDGLQDYLVTRHEWDKDALSLRKPAGVFAPGFGLPPADRHGCAAGDVNNDLRPDLYCMLGAERGEGQKQNELWIAQPDGTYVDESALWGVTDPLGRGRRPVFLNFNNDGRLDLYITNFGPRPDGQRSENILFLNAGDKFVEHGVTATGQHGSACAETGDWNKDGRTDLLVCGPQLKLFRNAAGMDTELTNGLLGSEQVAWPKDAKLADLNGDGRDDLVTVTKDELQIRLNRATGVRFSTVHNRVALADGMSVAIADVTTDGFPDVYVVQGRANGRNADDLLLTGPSWFSIFIPQTDVGYGATADIIDVAGRKTVLVTNGFDLSRGPVQFISFRQS